MTLAQDRQHISTSLAMMSLHQNFPVAWGPERMDGLTLDLGLDGMFSPLPTDLSVASKEPESSWRFFGQSLTQENAEDLDGDPTVLRSSCEPEKKPDMFELSLSYPPVHQQRLINMKFEREDVVPNATAGMPSLPTDLISENVGSRGGWRNLEFPHRELDLYGGMGGRASNGFADANFFPEIKPGRSVATGVPAARQQHDVIILDEDTDEDLSPETKPDRSASISVPTIARQHPELIDLDGDTDDEFFFEEGDFEDDLAIMTPPEDASRSKEQGFMASSQAMPLRQIKQHVRSLKTEEEFSHVTPSVAEAMMYYGSKDLETGARSQQGKTQSKRGRGYSDHDWLPSDLLDVFKDERSSESKRARGNSEQDQPYGPPIVVNSQCGETSAQVQTQKPIIDVNQAIREMPQRTAEAFKELFKLVGASQTIDEIETSRSATHDIQHSNPAPLTPSFFGEGRRCPSISCGVDEVESKRSIIHDMQHCTPQPRTPCFFGEGQCGPSASPSADEIESVFGTAPLGPSESGSQSPCSSHAVLFEQRDKGVPNAHVVLYEPKPEPLESIRESTAGSVVRVKQEIEQNQNIPDGISSRPGEENAVGPFMTDRKLILTALHTFEQVRQQIIKDPSYGQTGTGTNPTPTTTPTTMDGSKMNMRRVRADLKAACLMRKKGFWLNDRVRPIGEVPGVAVGDCFRYRIQMAVIGLHRAVQAGIAVIPVEHNRYGRTLASSVVIGVSDPYQDDNDMGDTVVYSGQGGLCCKTKESRDQELKRGNLALSNSFDLKLPVRLIRGHKEQNGFTGISYSYDGLYQITNMNYVTGVNGKKVYKFNMERLPGQAPLLGIGCPAPLVSQLPALQQAENALQWTG